MANEELGKLSQEQIQKLADTISEAKNLTNQQEEIIKQVLAGETEIGKQRVAYLETYFDSYSRKLEAIKIKQRDLLDDTFSILNKKLAESYNTLSSDIAKLDQQLANKAKYTSNQNAAATRTTRRKNNSRPPDEGHEALQELRRSNNRSNRADSLSGYTQNANFTSNRQGRGQNSQGGQANSYVASNAAVSNVSTTVEDAERRQLEIGGLQSFLTQAANNDNQLISANDLEVEQVEHERKLLKDFENEKKAIEESLIALEIARSKKEEELLLRSVEFRLDKLKETTNAELAAQKALNQIEVQLANTNTDKGISTKEFGSLQTRQLNAEQDLEAAKQLEEQIANYRAKLNYESMSRNNGVLKAEEAEANERLVQEYFADYESQLERVKKINVLAKNDPKLAEALEKKRIDFITKEEYKARKANNGRLEAEELARIRRQADEEFELTEEMREKLEKAELKSLDKKLKEEEKARAKAGDNAVQAAVSGPLTKDNNLVERFKALKELTRDESGDKIDGAGIAVALKAISDLAAQLNASIDKIASYQGDIDTRLQGSNNKTNFAGSYWGQLTKDMMSVGAVTPFFKQEDFANNIKSLVDRGISFDLKQRAFLMTIQEKIANTFDVADGTLLRLIRIQQEDSTAGRLGMESALNSFLNEMYETSEYLTDVAKSVRSSLEEMEALMSGAEAAEVEYQVQKWMGSLYSVGMSQEAVQSIASTLGQLAAGQVEALTNGNGAGNLLVMAANDAGLTISDILAEGLNADQTNKLLQATVNYLADIAEASKDNNVVQQQLANVFGVKASDLRAAVNLASDNTTANIFAEYKTYGNMLKQLNDMAGTMYSRTSIGELMTNVWENGQYTLASSMANNPAAYLTYKMASLLEATTGGINLPFVSVLGSGVDLNTTVADLMRVAAVGTGILGSIGPMISGLGSSFNGRSMLEKMGIGSGSGLAITPRGDNGVSANDLTSLTNGGGAQTTSGSGYVGNASGSDIKNSTLQEAEDTKKQQMIEAKEEAEANQIDFINTNVLKIYELLDEVTSGKRSFNVKAVGYGLTNNTYSSGAQGGVNGLLSNSPANNSSSLSGGFTSSNASSGTSGTSVGNYGSTGGSAASSNDGFGLGSNINLGGWTVT